MATNSVSPIDVVSAVEEYYNSLPAKRRGRRTRAEIDAPIDDEPESENYVADSEPEPDPAALAQFRLLLRQLRQARSDVVAEVITAKIYRLLGLELDGGK